MIIIHNNGISYILESLDGELIDETHQRLWKIIQHQPTSDYIFEELVSISKLWFYKRKLYCQYSDSLEAKIKLF